MNGLKDKIVLITGGAGGIGAAAAERFAAAGVALETLSSYEAIVAEARSSGAIPEEYESILREWRRNPSAWGRK